MTRNKALISRRIPPVPEAFPKGDDTDAKKKKGVGGEKGEDHHRSNPVSPLTLEASKSQGPIAGGVQSEIAFQPIKRVIDVDHREMSAKASSSRLQAEAIDRTTVLNSTEAEAPAVTNSPAKKKDLSQVENVSKVVAKSSLPLDIFNYPPVKQSSELSRETLCITWGKKVWDDLAEATIYPVLDIEHIDEDMITRVKDLVRCARLKSSCQ